MENVCTPDLFRDSALAEIRRPCVVVEWGLCGNKEKGLYADADMEKNPFVDDMVKGLVYPAFGS
jgi:hypothetical protein